MERLAIGQLLHAFEGQLDTLDAVHVVGDRLHPQDANRAAVDFFLVRDRFIETIEHPRLAACAGVGVKDPMPESRIVLALIVAVFDRLLVAELIEPA